MYDNIMGARLSMGADPLCGVLGDGYDGIQDSNAEVRISIQHDDSVISLQIKELHR